jgi:hypothetical protein
VYYFPGATGWSSPFDGLPAELIPLTFTTNAGAITVTGYVGSGSTMTIPNIIDSLPVTAIAADAFENLLNLNSVTIPATITNIGDAAFSGCTSLTIVNFLGNAPTVGLSVFASDSNATVTYWPGTTGWSSPFAGLPSVPEGTGQAAFTYTINDGAIDITGYVGSGGVVIIPTNINGLTVTSIGEDAFYATSLTSVTIPGSVTNIGFQAFSGCSSLIAITVAATNLFYSSTNGVLFDKSQSTLIAYPGGIGGSYTIPNSVTSIGDVAFQGCILTNVTIPDSVTNIGAYAFLGIGLGSLTIPGSVLSIGYGAFNSCFALSNVIIDNGVASIGANAFGGCSGLRSVTIPDSVTSIGAGAFSQTSLTSVTIPSGITNISEGTFDNCGNLTSVILPYGVASIESNAFCECTSLTSITIPGSVTNIGDDAFEYCNSLTSVYFQGNAPTADATVFTDDNNATAYYLPGTTGWGSTFAGRPAALWKPIIQTDAASFGLSHNQFGFTITDGSTTNIPIVVEACTNLASPDWIPLQSLKLNHAPFHFSDPQWTNFPARFYRISSP